jgi:cytochrome c-type biogenesis protein CcmH/NrfG
MVRARPVVSPLTTMVATLLIVAGGALLLPGARAAAPPERASTVAPTNNSAVGNFTASIDRLVELLGLAGSGILALVWARVALSWFSNDITKKVQAKDRARDALIGTLLFVAAVSGLIWGLAHWVLTGT